MCLATCQWSRVNTIGNQQLGRYGHSLNLVESKLFLFGGEVDGIVFNDLFSFDLNLLQQSEFQWEPVVTNTDSRKEQTIPDPRTNHSIVNYRNSLFLSAFPGRPEHSTLIFLQLWRGQWDELFQRCVAV